MSTKVVIIGAGGFGRETLDVFDACNRAGQDYDVLGFIVEAQFGSVGALVNGKPVLGDLDWLKGRADEVYVVCGVGAPELRLRLVRAAEVRNARFCSIIHPSVIMTRWMTVGKGTVIAAGCILSNTLKLGNHVHINPGNIIGHDVVMEDFATLAPGTRISGNVLLREGCYIGTGANIIEKKEIGAWAIVGAGATVVADVPANTTVVGTPARVIKVREEGWHTR